jgi:molecular chaperone GrpE
MPEELVVEAAEAVIEPPLAELPEAEPPVMQGEPEAAQAEVLPPLPTTPVPALPEALVDELTALRRCVEEGPQTLLKAFESKLAFDQHKEKQIDSLHAELQEHKRDLLARATRPLLSGLVRLHDSLGRMPEDLRGESPEELTPERFFGILEDFQDDVEIVLEDNGVSLFLEPCERFEPRRQTSRRTVETIDESRVGTIAHRARPGFEQEGTLLQKERVDVYVRAQPASEEKPEPQESIPEPKELEENE